MKEKVRSLFTEVIVLTLISLCAPVSLSAQTAEVDVGTALLNAIAPGTLQIAQGKEEGWWYTPGFLMAVCGTVLVGKSYVPGPDSSPTVPLGMLLATSGAMLECYSFYAYASDEGAIWPGYQRQALLDLMAAPFNPPNLQSTAILPVVGLAFLASIDLLLEPDRAAALQDFYGRSEVSFWGLQLNPWAATALYAGFALVLSDFVAVEEETTARGMVSGFTSPAVSSLLFGSLHLPNLFLMDLTPRNVINTTLQALSAFLGGLYMDSLTREDGGSLQRPIAFHYWWDVLALVSNLATAVSDPTYVSHHSTADRKPQAYLYVDAAGAPVLLVCLPL